MRVQSKGGILFRFSFVHGRISGCVDHESGLGRVEESLGAVQVAEVDLRAAAGDQIDAAFGRAPHERRSNLSAGAEDCNAKRCQLKSPRDCDQPALVPTSPSRSPL